MIVGSILTLGKDELTEAQWKRLFTTLTFTDADDNVVTAYDYVPAKDIVRLPRGAWSLVPSSVSAQDRRTRPSMPKLRYVKELGAEGYEGQEEAVTAMFEYEQGQVIAPPGRGKTEICLAFAAAARTRTLVIVHTRDLFKQWCDRIEQSLENVVAGKIQGKTCQVEHITVAMAQTVKQGKYLHTKFLRQFGCLIVDEAHHGAAETWEWILNSCPAYYRFGVTASERRSDRREPLVKFNIGPVFYKLKFRSQVPMTIIPAFTNFSPQYGGSQWTQLIRRLVNDHDRNDFIAHIIVDEIAKGSTILVLSRQIKHLQNIGVMLGMRDGEAWKRTKLVTGQLPQRQRNDLIQQLRDGEISCILGTQLFEEGVDIPQIDCIILAFPGTSITVLQKIGRGSRKHEGKTETRVYDIVDQFSTTLVTQYLGRQQWYKGKEGITLAKPIKEATYGRQKGKRKAGVELLRSLRPSRPGVV